MATEDTRVRTLASVAIFDPGAADPVITDRGFAWYDILAATHGFGSSNRTTQGELKLEWVEGIGLACRPFLTEKDTRITNWTAGTGSWEERRPAVGRPRVYWLNQYSSAADLNWSIVSKWEAPADPHLAFQLSYHDTHSDHDETTYPIFWRIELGVDGSDVSQWGIEGSELYGLRLVRYVAGAWQAELNLGEVAPLAQQNLQKTVILLRPMRGFLCISVDLGRTYSLFRFPTAAAAIRAGKVRFRGSGQAIEFNVSQIFYNTGIYTSPTRNTFTSRLTASPSILGSYDLPGVSAIAFADVGVPASGIAGYTATLTPGTVAGTPFTFYTTPTLYAVQYVIPVTAATYWGGYQELDDNAILAIDISKPFELDGATAVVRFWKDAGIQFDWPYGRWPFTNIQAGFLHEDGSTTNWTVFSGHVRTVEPAQGEYGRAEYLLTIDNVSVRFKRSTWNEIDGVVPLGGQTLNQALDDILATEGLTSTYRSWHFVGDLFVLPSGLAEEPFEYPKAGESKWETMVRIAGYAGLEIGITDDGRFVSVPRFYSEPFIYDQLQGSPTAQEDAVASMQARLDNTESATAVLVSAVDSFGGRIYGFAVDSFAEQVPISGRFCPWRECVQETIQGTANLAMVVGRAQALAAEHFGLRVEPDVQALFRPDIGRRFRVQVTGTYLGIRDTDELVVLALTHRILPVPTDCSTMLGVRRLGL